MFAPTSMFLRRPDPTQRGPRLSQQARLQSAVLKRMEPLYRYPKVRRFVSRLVIDKYGKATSPRPRPLSMAGDYTSWRSLTDRTFSGRHLPPATGESPRRPPEAEVVHNAVDQVGLGGQDALQRSTLACCPSAHRHPEGRLQIHVHQAGGMCPVLEQPPWTPSGSPVEQSRVVTAHPTEQRHVVGPDGHVHRVDLKLADPVDHLLKVSRGHRAGGPVTTETLGRERDAAGLGAGQIGHGPDTRPRLRHNGVRRSAPWPPRPVEGGSRRSRRPCGGRPRWVHRCRRPRR